ncbi:tail virion protein G7P-2 [Arsenophonus sp.]
MAMATVGLPEVYNLIFEIGIVLCFGLGFIAGGQR